MNTCHTCNATNPKPLQIRMPQMPFDEKLLYIESILDVLTESRFGPAYAYSYLEMPTSAADEPLSFLDLPDQENIPFYASEYLLQRLLLQMPVLQKPARSKGTLSAHSTLVQNHPTFAPDNLNLTSSTPARGSPKSPDALLP